MKAWPIVAAVLVVGAGGYGLVRWRQQSATPLIHYETVALARGKIASRVTATGTLSALVTVQVGSQVSGRIQQLMVDFNSPVKKGEVLARIDPQLFDASLAQAKANVRAAEGGVVKAKAQAADAVRQSDRAKTLVDQRILSQAEYDTALTNTEAAKAQIDVAEGALAQAQAAYQLADVNLQYTTISSPIDGIVISRSVDVGQTVAASLSAPTLFTLAEDMAKMQVDTNVAEADVGKLRPEMPATFTVDAYPSERFRGTVRQIRNAAQVVQSVVTYDAVIDVANADLKLKPGMTANVTFTWAEKDDVLEIPNAALRFRPPGSVEAAATAKASKAPAPAAGAAPTAGAAPAAGAAPPSGATSAATTPAASGASAPATGAPSAGPTDAGARTAGGGEHGGHGDHAGAHGGKRAGPTDQRTIWVLRDGAPVPVPIRVGISDGSLTELVEGEVKEGDLVITDSIGGDAPKATAPGGGAGANAFRGRMF